MVSTFYLHRKICLTSKKEELKKFTVTELKQTPDGNHKFDSRRRRKGL
jgi:hypothetical protein